ncbi:MAG: hypothetical protein CME64_17865 [Halobacteriovoraceae bacterium]|nr:hypothetical protein [Halobacteriovoraceae bacterium]|tara:strand:- start:7517 stop:8437 length:921 start_codon:yes stop_codon:yes gene_type:complete
MKLLLPILIASPFLWAQEYKVRPLAKGETISDILYNDNYQPLYGENEWVDKVLKLNRLSESQAKKLDPNTLLIVPTRKNDIVRLKQAARLKRGILSNRIPEHQIFKVGFALHSAESNTQNETVTSNENFGLTLSFENKDAYSWNGYKFNPKLDLAVLGHGANQANSQTIATYETTYRLSSNLQFRTNESFSFGPEITFELASRSSQFEEDLIVRRDGTVFLGGFANYRFTPFKDFELNTKGTIQRTIVENNADGLESLNALRTDLKISTLITTHTEAHIFTQIETYENANLDSRLSTGAGFSYLIK